MRSVSYLKKRRALKPAKSTGASEQRSSRAVVILNVVATNLGGAKSFDGTTTSAVLETVRQSKPSLERGCRSGPGAHPAHPLHPSTPACKV